MGKPVRKVLGKHNYNKVYVILSFPFSTHYNVELNETNRLPIIFPEKKIGLFMINKESQFRIFKHGETHAGPQQK